MKKFIIYLVSVFWGIIGVMSNFLASYYNSVLISLILVFIFHRHVPGILNTHNISQGYLTLYIIILGFFSVLLIKIILYAISKLSIYIKLLLQEYLVEDHVLVVKRNLKRIKCETKTKAEFSLLRSGSFDKSYEKRETLNLQKDDTIELLKELIKNVENKIQLNNHDAIDTCKHELRLLNQRLQDAEELKKNVSRIESHYEQIRKELSSKYSIKNKHIDSLINVYSFENIKKAIIETNNKHSSDELAFIGDKVGLYTYEETRELLTLHVYKTDHYTFHVFKRIYKNNLDVFKPIIDIFKQAKNPEKELVIKMLSFLFSSMGSDIILYGYGNKKKKYTLASRRSASIEGSRLSMIHVPVNESFSETDKMREEYSVYEWVKRGVQEEIGISSDKIKNEDIHFHDFAFDLLEGEIGFSCHVLINDNIEKATFYAAQDKHLECENIITVEYPNYYELLLLTCATNENIIKKIFAKKTDSADFFMKWTSFVPILYIRFYTRQLQVKPVDATKLNPILDLSNIIYIVLASIAMPIFIVAQKELEKINFNNIVSVIKSVKAEELLASGSIILAFLITYFIARYNKQKKYKYKIIKEWTPKWHGNAKILQSATNSGENMDFIILLNDASKTEHNISLKDLRLIFQPRCAVRKQKVDTEIPISFYTATVNSGGTSELKLKSYCYSKFNLKYYTIKKRINSKDKQIYMSLLFPVPDIKLTFDKDLKNDSILKKYFEKETSDCFTNKTLAEQISSQGYSICDLMEYRKSYFWTLNRYAKIIDNSTIKGIIIDYLYETTIDDDKLQSIVNSINYEISSANNEFTVIVTYDNLDTTSNKEIFIISINEISANNERKFEIAVNYFIDKFWANKNGHLSELEVLGLQQLLIRDELLVADVTYLSLKNRIMNCLYRHYSNVRNLIRHN